MLLRGLPQKKATKNKINRFDKALVGLYKRNTRKFSFEKMKEFTIKNDGIKMEKLRLIVEITMSQ